MKNYGANKATEFNKRDLAPIYKAAKNGELKIEKWFMNQLYDLAEYYGYDDNGSVADREREILNLLKLDDKQEEIDKLTQRWFNLSSRKRQERFNRELVK